MPPQPWLSPSLFFVKAFRPTFASLFHTLTQTPPPVGNSYDHYHLSRALLSSTDARYPLPGLSIHAHLLRTPPQLTSSSFSLWNKLLNLYVKCGLSLHSRRLFDEMTHRDHVSYNTLLKGCDSSEAIRLYSQMLREVIAPNNVTFAVLLGSSIRSASVMEELHAHVLKLGLASNEFVGGSLVSGYTRFRNLEMAFQAFDEIEELDTVTWNVMIDACARCGSVENAVHVFSRMRCYYDGVGFDYFSLTSVLKTCLRRVDLGFGMQLHGCALKAGLGSDTPVGNALITMYSNCEGGMKSASNVFEEVQDRDIISWTAFISGFSQNGLGRAAFQLYIDMLRSGLMENEFTFASILPAVGSIASIEQGRQIHARISKSLSGIDVGVGNALIDMYFKCGSSKDAQLVFETLQRCDSVTWTALITGLGQHGKGKEAVNMFKAMGSRGLQPDGVTFLSVLAACSHGGLVDEGIHIFHSMSTVYGIKPNRKHFACVVDLLGRAGKLEDAERFIRDMGIEMDPLAWDALLGACVIHGEMEIGQRSAEKLMELEPCKDGPYIMLSNMFAEKGLWEEKGSIRQKLQDNGLAKVVAHSWSTGNLNI